MPTLQKDKVVKRESNPAGAFTEIGTPGRAVFAGVINEAYLAELRWPHVWPLYKRILRADPEVAVARYLFETLARQVEFEPQLPENPSDDDKRALEFVVQALDDIDGGMTRFIQKAATHVPLLGWGWWEAIPGRRDTNWRPPDAEDPWRSRYSDGLVGIRRLAWRDPSSFMRWDIDDYTGRLRGMVQMDIPNPLVTIPLNRSVHLTFGDPDNPEGLPVLESMYRLERYKFGLEVVQGIGYEHTAGYLSVPFEKQPSTEDQKRVKAAARAILTAQEGNYAAWPPGVKGEFIDVDFTAGRSLLDVIRYYSMLKLQLVFMQWVAMSTTSSVGSYSAVQDSTKMFIVTFNAMMAGFADQFDQQVGRRLFQYNPGAFPGMTARPRIAASRVSKEIDLKDLADFMTAFGTMFELSEQDQVDIRRQSGVLGEVATDTVAAPRPAEEKKDPEPPSREDELDDEPNALELSAPGGLASRAVAGFMVWAEKHAPQVYNLLSRRGDDGAADE